MADRGGGYMKTDFKKTTISDPNFRHHLIPLIINQEVKEASKTENDHTQSIDMQKTSPMEVDEELLIPGSSNSKSCREDEETETNSYFEPVVFPETESESNNPASDWRKDKCIRDIMEYALEKDEETFKDVTFLVGPNRVPISAHKYYLGIISTKFADVFFKHPTLKEERRHLNLLLPDTSPKSFRLFLRYIYVRRVEVDMDEAVEVLKLAYRFKISDLIAKCVSQLRCGLSSTNAAEILQVAWSFPVPRLKECALVQITLDPKTVFKTPGFLALELDPLCAVLKRNLNLDEVSIFLEMKRWAEHSIKKKSLTEDVKIRGEDIRKELGKALFLIRFPLMTGEEFYKHVANAEILRLEEKFRVMETMVPGYDFGRAVGLPFSSEPRLRKKIVPAATSSTDTVRCTGVKRSENETSRGFKGDQTERIKEEKGPKKKSRVISYEMDPNGCGKIRNDNSRRSATEINDQEKQSQSQLIKNKEAYQSDYDEERDKNKSVPSSKRNRMELRKPKIIKMLTQEEENYIKNNMGSETGNNLTNFYKQLKVMLEDGQQMQIIREDHPPVVINTTIAQNMDFRHLTHFHVNYLSSNETIQSFKKYISKLNISHLLPFQKFNHFEDLINLYYMPDGTDGGKREVNVTITLNGIVILKADVRENSLTLSRIDTSIQWIMEGVNKSNGLSQSLKSIHLEECVTSLELLPFQSLENITLREVRGLRNFAVFLQKCTNLREFSCTEIRSETIDFGVHLGLLTPQGTKLRRIALRHARIHCSNPPTPLNNKIEELYLDNCQLSPSFVQGFNRIFPNLKKLKIFRPNSVNLILNALKIDNLEWLGVWEPNWTNSMPKQVKGRGKKLNVPIDSEINKIFKDAGFDDPWMLLNDKAFIMVRQGRNKNQNVQPRTTDLKQTSNKVATTQSPVQTYVCADNPPEMTRPWLGKKIRNKVEEFGRLDYEQFGWAVFYKDYDLFQKMKSEWELKCFYSGLKYW